MAVPVDGHPDAVEERCQDDHDLGVVLLQSEVAHEPGLDAVLRELAEELERDVRDDLDVHPGVVVDLQPRDRVHVGDVPPTLELVVGVDVLDQRAELAVAAHRDPDPHARDGLGGCEPGLVLGLGVDRLLDPLGRLLVQVCVFHPWAQSDGWRIDGHVHDPHPIRLAVEDDYRRTRLTVFFRLLLAIPHLIWFALWTVWIVFTAFVNWLISVFTGRPPDWFHHLMCRYVRYQAHLGAYLSLTADPYPGFMGDPGSYPIDIELPPEPVTQKRWTILLRLVLFIPALL